VGGQQPQVGDKQHFSHHLLEIKVPYVDSENSPILHYFQCKVHLITFKVGRNLLYFRRWYILCLFVVADINIIVIVSVHVNSSMVKKILLVHLPSSSVTKL
jgi:hypothetical protein